MTGQEGVIKFELIQPVLRRLYFSSEIRHQLSQLNAWRKRLFQLDIIGCDLSRYGACYGNVSMRYVLPESTMGYSFVKPAGLRSFLISCTQTGKVEELTEEHYARVYKYDVSHHRVYAEGPCKPSSEAMTHGAVYDLPLAADIRVVFHVHSPHLWKKAEELGIPITREEVEYGTPEMAREVRRLYQETDLLEKRIFSMGGHEDGIISFGSTADEAGMVMLAYVQRAVKQ